MTTQESFGLAIVVAAAMWLIWKSGDKPADASFKNELTRHAARIQIIEDWKIGAELAHAEHEKSAQGFTAALRVIHQDIAKLGEQVTQTQAKASTASDLAHQAMIDRSKPMRVILDGAVQVGKRQAPPKPKVNPTVSARTLKQIGEKQKARAETLRAIDKQMKKLEK